MAKRRDGILEQTGLYVPPAHNPLEPPPMPHPDDVTSDSTYVPSLATTQDASMADSTGTQLDAGSILADLAPMSRSFGSQQSLSLGYSLSGGTPLFLVTPQSPLADGDYMALLGNLMPQSLVPQHLEQWLKKATRDNQAAYAAWKRELDPAVLAMISALSEAKTADVAGVLLLPRPTILLDLLDALPYAPVILAGTCGLLRRLGAELLILGRVEHVKELTADPETPPPATQIIAPWLTAIEHCSTSAEKWSLANSAARWGRIRTRIKKFKTPARTLQRVSDTEWGELMAHLMVNSRSLPPVLRDLPAATRCRHLICWTAQPAHASVARAGIAAFTNGS